MALPTLNTITITGSFVDMAGTALAGTVTFTPPAELVDATGTTFIEASPIVEVLDINGHFSTVLICTDNANLTPAGWVYSVTENIHGLRSYTILLPHTLGSSVDLATLAPVTGV